MAEPGAATHVSFLVYFPPVVHLSFDLSISCVCYFLKVKVITSLDFLTLLFLPYKLCLLVDYQTLLWESQIITAMCLHMKNLFLLNLFQVHLGVVRVVETF